MYLRKMFKCKKVVFLFKEWLNVYKFGLIFYFWIDFGIYG